MFSYFLNAASILLIALSSILLGCNREGPFTPSQTLLPVVVGSSPATFRMDPATILEAVIFADQLHVAVQFGGGCAEHHFSLLHSGVFRPAAPVETDLQLTHDAHGDPCRAILGRELVFDLTPLKTMYLGSRREPGSILIRLYEPGSTAPFGPPLRYDF
jgi:hypothetical protein